MDTKEPTNIDQEVAEPTPTDPTKDSVTDTSADATQAIVKPAPATASEDEATLADTLAPDDVEEASAQDVEEITVTAPTHVMQEGGRPSKAGAPTLEAPRTTASAAARVVTADSVEAEEVPTIPLGSLQQLSALQPEVSVHSVAATQSVSIPAPLVVQPSEYRRSISEWLQLWWDGLRPAYLPLALMPLFLGHVLAWSQTVSTQKVFGSFHLTHFIGSIVAVVLLQLGANLINDYYDYLRGVDTANTLGPGALIQQGLIRPTSILTLGFSFLGIGTLIGLVVALIGGPLVYLFGLLGILGAYFYSATSRSLSSLGLGEFVGFCVFGPLITLGAYMVQSSGKISLSAFIYSLAPGLLAAAVIHLNNMRDSEGDAHASKYTLASRIGLLWSRVWSLVLLLAAYVIIIVLAVPHGAPHFALLSLWTLPSLVVIITGVLRTDTPAGFDLAMRQTIKLLTLFTILLIIGLVISALIPVLPRIPLHVLPV